MCGCRFYFVILFVFRCDGEAADWGGGGGGGRDMRSE